MAKLNVVIPTTDVEVIGADGTRTKYRKVERAAKAGDVIKITDSDATSYVIEGAFYEVKRLDLYDDPQIIGEDGDEFDAAGVGYEVYEKVAEASAQATQQYREEQRPLYKEVKRPAKVGERIKIVNEQMACGEYKTGAEMVVTEAKWPKIHSVNADYNGTEQHLFYEEYVVLEPIDERLTVGDIVKTLDENGFCKIGDIVKIVEDDGSDVPYRLESLSGEYAGWLLEDNVVRATEAEVEAAKEALDPRNKFAKGDKVRLVSGGNNHPLYGFSNGEIYTVSDPKTTRHYGERVRIADADGLYGYALPDQLEKVSAEELAEIEKWAAIGRKVNEFKPGDLVQITGNTNSSVNSVGDIGVVTEGPRHGTGSYRVDAGNGDASNWTLPDEMRLLAPVEQRFDREEAA